MKLSEETIAKIFSEWARRYAEDPGRFGEILDSEGKAVSDYGTRCAKYFTGIAKELKEE